jgi:single-strand DNA-binding protein
MASLNKVMQIGRVVSDPEVRPAGNSGSTVAKFRLVVGRSKKNQQTGQWENDPNQMFIDVEAWHRPDQKRNLCDVIQRFVQKGKEVFVEGRLQLDEWEDKNGGGKRSKHKIVVDNLELLGGRESGGESGEQQSGGFGGGYGDQPAEGGGLPF